MANTAVSVCSNALTKLGDDPITSLTDNTDRARKCNRLFDPTRQAVLRDSKWKDSRKRQKLAQLVNAPVWEFGFAYALPSDYMRLVKTSLDEPKIPYRIEGKTLLTNASEVYLTYVYDNSDIASYDALHVDTLTTRMAYELANAITAKNSLSDRMASEYDKKNKDAQSANGDEDTPEELIDTTLIDARF